MKTTAGRKEIQEKLNFIISKYVNLLIKTDSKKIKKSIKKASKIIAKAIAKKINESDGQITLQKSADVKQVRSFKLKKATIKRHVKNPIAKRATAKPIQKAKKSTVKKATAKPVQKTKAKTTSEDLNVSKTSSVILESN